MKVVKAMDCKACRKEIEEAIKDEPRSAKALAHLESCARCRVYNQEQNALRELVASLGTITAPNDFDWRLRARLAADRGGAYRQRFRRGFAPGLPAIGLAASFVLLIAAAVFFKQADVRLNPGTIDVANAPARSVAETRATASVKSQEVNSGAVVNSVAVNTTKSSAVNRLRVARATQTRNPKVETRAPELTVAANANPSLRSNDFSSTAAQVVSLFSIPVRTPAQPLRVLLDEGRGTMRTVALQPVTFGSQKILERGGAASSGLDTGADEVW